MPRINIKTADGFTFIEILVTIVMIALIIPVAMKGISVATAVSSDSKNKLQAIRLAENRLAEILMYNEWNKSSESGTFSDDDSQYKWLMTVCDSSENNLKELSLEVSWQQRGHDRNVTLNTLVYNGN